MLASGVLTDSFYQRVLDAAANPAFVIKVRLRPTKQRPVLRSGLALIAIGVLAVVSLLIHNRGLEDTVPFVLYLVAWSTIPLGLLLCLVAVCLNLIKGRPNLSR
jgi:hypothetical protein